mmetsp:Transcript_6827/g.21349  ORF Transcript_6827/g.21349 Transcript_6827/m.21349 type:complete len:93 (+) Transcript_6827:344-622(+)
MSFPGINQRISWHLEEYVWSQLPIMVNPTVWQQPNVFKLGRWSFDKLSGMICRLSFEKIEQEEKKYDNHLRHFHHPYVLAPQTRDDIKPFGI